MKKYHRLKQGKRPQAVDTGLPLVVTTAGKEAAINADKNGLQLKITEVALGREKWAPDENATALKDEIKRLSNANIAGISITGSAIHLSFTDGSTDQYPLGEFGLYTDTDVLFAIFSNPDQLITEKLTNSILLLSADMNLDSVPPDSVVIEGTGFINPPATETRAGVINEAPDDGNQYARSDKSWAVLGAEILIGSIIEFPRATRMTGFLITDGRTVNASEYPDLVFYLTGDKNATEAVLPTKTDPTGKFTYGIKAFHAVTDDAITNLEQIIEDAKGATHSPIGCVMDWLLPVPPTGWLELNGQTILAVDYPVLVKRLAGTAASEVTLPDCRGEFIRGWDHGRGVDANRGLLSWQADMFKSHTHNYQYGDSHGIRAGSSWNAAHGDNINRTFTSHAAGGTETRPRSIAMMKIIKAADFVDDEDKITADSVIQKIDTMAGNQKQLEQKVVKLMLQLEQLQEEKTPEYLFEKIPEVLPEKRPEQIIQK